MSFAQELKEILKAWLAISIAFGIIIFKKTNSYSAFLIAALTVGSGFLFHELAHRYYARKFGKHAEFKANNLFLLLAIVTSFLDFIIAIPGAVIISGFVNRKEGGIIAAAGPAANLIIALIFLPLMLIIPSIAYIAYYGLMINAWLALFNLIPFPGFDGHRIMEWSKPIYFLMVGVAVVAYVINMFL
jgi:Zn-dependent protease